MSEYQRYEFLAIDQPLSREDQRELRRISSRAEITSGSFVNTYSWGDLRADPDEMLLRWFDAFLYVSNFGSCRLSFRVPRGVLRADELAPYAGDGLSYHEDARHLAVHFRLEEESPGDWLEHEGLLGRLLPLRQALVTGDHRCLYLSWLLDVHLGRIGEDEEEPAVPPGSSERDAAIEAFVELMKIDEDLVAAAAEASVARAPGGADDGAARNWLAAQRDADKDAWLLRVLDGDGARLGLELRRRLRDETAPTGAIPHPRRTSGALLQRAETLRVERQERQFREREEERRLRAAREAAERDRHLDRLVGKDEALWKTVDALVAVKQAREYDQAVALLEDLRDLAAREGRTAAWTERFEALRQRHERLRGFVKRLDEIRR